MLIELGIRARQAARLLALAPADQKNAFLMRLAELLDGEQAPALAANRLDYQEAAQNEMTPAFLDRLMLNPERLHGMAADVRTVAALPDPIGEVIEATTLPNGLRVRRQRVPLGVLGVVYESRPNVTVDVAAVALKTGNAAILRGGSDTLRSNLALASLIAQASTEYGLPAAAIQLIADPDRQRVLELLELQEYVDMIIPRGGAGLHQFCRQHAKIPVITGGIGICHLYVDMSADLPAALEVIYNAKVQRPTVCNALDTVLVHTQVAGQFLPQIVNRLSQAGVSFRADASAAAHLTAADGLQDFPAVMPAGPDDFDTEWLALILGLKVVNGLEEAIQHIAEHSTGHSDGILTGEPAHAERFVVEVDSAAVYVNASTRFTDGGQLGLGAEVAVSTQRLHARGPMGLRELTTYKWVVMGDYHVRS